MASQNYMRLRLEPEILDDQIGMENDADQWFVILFASCYTFDPLKPEFLDMFVTYVSCDAPNKIFSYEY